MEPQIVEAQKHSDNKPPIIISIIITTLFVGGSVFLWQNSENNKLRESYEKRLSDLENKLALSQISQSVVNVSPTVTPTKKISISIPDSPINNWGEFMSPLKILELSHYRLFYPKTWKMVVDKREKEPKMLNVKLQKNNTEINIFQGAGGGGNCLFPNDPNKEGYYIRYGEYKEISKGDYIWRVAKPENQQTYNVCGGEKNNMNFIDMASPIGWITLRDNVNDETTLQEFYEILEKLEILD